MKQEKLADNYSQNVASKYSRMQNNRIKIDISPFQTIKKLGIKDKTILDFGCGDGSYSKKFIEERAKKVIGIDNSSSMIQIAKVKHSDPSIEYFKQDGAKLLLPKNSFDLVFASYVLQNFKNATVPLKQIYKVLKQGGYLVAIVPITLLKPKNEKLANTIIKICIEKKITINVYIKTDKELQSNIKKAGFSIEKVKKEDNPLAEVEGKYKSKIKAYKSNIYVAQKPAKEGIYHH